MIDALDKKIEVVLQEEKNAKLSAETNEQQREAMIAEIQAKNKQRRTDKDIMDDTMELDDMPNTGGGTLSNLLGLKRNK